MPVALAVGSSRIHRTGRVQPGSGSHRAGVDLVLPQRFRRGILAYASHGLRDLPWRRRTTPYRVLVSELMLQRTGAAQVAAVYSGFLRQYPSLRSAARASGASLRKSLSPLGRTKRYRDIARAFAYLSLQHGGRIPSQEKALLAIPAVGMYTARAVQCFGYGLPVGLVDPSIYRVLSRVFRIRSARKRFHTDVRLWYLTDRLVPKLRVREYNWALLDLASALCLRVAPRCGECPLASICRFSLRGD